MKIYPITLITLKKYLQITTDNSTYDDLLILLMDAIYTKIEMMTGLRLIVNQALEGQIQELSESNSIIDIAAFKDIATNFKNRENDSNEQIYMMTLNTKQLIRPYVKQIAY